MKKILNALILFIITSFFSLSLQANLNKASLVEALKQEEVTYLKLLIEGTTFQYNHKKYQVTKVKEAIPALTPKVKNPLGFAICQQDDWRVPGTLTSLTIDEITDSTTFKLNTKHFYLPESGEFGSEYEIIHTLVTIESVT